MLAYERALRSLFVFAFSSGFNAEILIVVVVPRTGVLPKLQYVSMLSVRVPFGLEKKSLLIDWKLLVAYMARTLLKVLSMFRSQMMVFIAEYLF